MADIELWRTLSPGDLIRISQIPSEFSLPGYQLHDCTRQIYQKLIDEQYVLRVRNIDDHGCPWIECGFVGDQGEEHHALMINHDGLELVSRSR